MPNTQLSSPKRPGPPSALRRKHKTRRKPKVPRVEGLLELLVMFYHKRLIYLAKNCIVDHVSRSQSHAQTHLAARGTKHQAGKSTSLPNEATRLSFNKRPLFPTKAQNNGKLPRQLPSRIATWQMRSKRLRASEI
ncbi:TPA: hypothetical protein RQK09_004469 [Vibrio vulnificus]|nr:hypothetical protein [Vibrio vulnificus]